MFNTNGLSSNELKEYNDVQVNYREGRGFSNDFLRFERYFHYIKLFNKFDLHCSILDVGCGPGPLENYFNKYDFKNVEAIDFSDEGVKIAKTSNPQYSYTVNNINNIKQIYKNRNFNIVFCCQVLEHLPNHINMFKQLYDLTSDNGMLIISVPWDKCKNNDRHINHYLPETFHNIANSIGAGENTIITERFGDCNLQLLFILLKEM